LQGQRCAYCGTRLFDESPHRDHIAPKGTNLHPEWTFQPRNIVLACYTCNSVRKKQFDTVLQKGRSYKTTTFSIVHPYLDDPRDHLSFTGHRLSIVVRPMNGSRKGAETIRLFDLASPERSKERAKDNLHDSDVEHLHGRWKRMAEQVILSPLPLHIALKIRS
jgi:uncharacterized protein (TIGR02646 family)